VLLVLQANDEVTCVVDIERNTIRFWLNGVCQGTAFTSGFIGCSLVPVVALGSIAGGMLSRVAMAMPCVTQLDRNRCNSRITLENADTTASTLDKWGTVLCLHPGVTGSSVLRFAVEVRTCHCLRLCLCLSHAVSHATCIGVAVMHVSAQLQRGDGGFAVGVVDPTLFVSTKLSMGVASGSWCLSRTGKVGDGTGFAPYAERIVVGDKIGVEVNMERWVHPIPASL
jgi:hypothetical protein